MKILTVRDAAFFLHREVLKRGAKDARKALAYAYCDGKSFYSTDGKMMVVSESEGNAKGWYLPAAREDLWMAAPPSVGFNPLNYKSVIPRPDAARARLVADLDRCAHDRDETIFTLQFLTLLLAKGAGRKESRCALFGQEYLDLLVRASVPFTRWEIAVAGGTEGGLFSTPCLTASPAGDRNYLRVVLIGRASRWDVLKDLRGAVEAHIPGFFASDPEE